MNLNFIGVNEKIVNLDAVALIEDVSDADSNKVVLTTTAGTDIYLEGTDADALLARCEMLLQATDAILARMQSVELPGGPQ